MQATMDCLQVKDKFVFKERIIMKEIFSRVSVRNFKEDLVEDDKCEKLLRAAMAAPSAGNEQPWEFYVVKDKDVLDKLSQCSPFAGPTKDAPMAVVVAGNENYFRFNGDYWQIDLSAAIENMLLEAVHLGLGGVWLGIAPLKDRMEKVAEVLNFPENMHAFAIVPFGYPKEEKAKEDRYDSKRVHFI